MGLAEIRALKNAAKLPKEKKKYSIPKVSEKKKKQIAEERGLRIDGSSEKERWFQERRTEMKGICRHCGGKSSKDSDEYFRHSLAHILPKNHFPSVKFHPLNVIELCFFSPSCHTNYDNYTIDITELNCFDEVIEKFVQLYPHIAAKEKKRIPAALLQYIETEK